MDLALTFHIGLIIRIPRTEEQQRDDLRILPFGRVFEKMEEAGTALTQAQSLTDYQAVGVRCREALLELISIAQDLATWTDKPPQREIPSLGGNHLQRSSAGRHKQRASQGRQNCAGARVDVFQLAHAFKVRHLA